MEREVRKIGRGEEGVKMRLMYINVRKPNIFTWSLRKYCENGSILMR